MGKYKVLLGGLGDDAHSIGSTLIKVSLEEKGYIVSFLGIQNSIHDFIKYSEDHDIILVSCINGHSELYLNNDDYNLKTLKYRGNKLWYVGGNLSVNKSNDYIVKLYREKGFTDVFPKPINVEELLFHISKDIERYHVYPKYANIEKLDFAKQNRNMIINNYNEFNSDEKFEELRRKILKSWKTGKDVSYDKARKNQMKSKNMDSVLWSAKINRNEPIIQPRTGVADLEKQLQLLRKLKTKGIGIASVQLDAASRRLYYEKAQEGLEKSIGSNISMLNGFPVPIHGVHGIEQLSHTLDLPFQIRGGAPDHRFVYEIGIAGGASSLEGGFLCYLLPYEKNLSPADCLGNWIYVDKICGIYHEKMNITINREFFGPLTTTLIEPSIPIVINIVEALSAASNGVKSVSVGIAEQGNRIQDIAAIRVLDELTQKYLSKYGYYDVRVTTVFHQYMGAFPSDELRAEKLIEESSITATLSNATRIMTKTPVEAFKIPDVEDNIRGIMLTRQGIKKAKDIKINTKKVIEEKKLIETEVISIMNMIELLGNGKIELGAIMALIEGIIDVPFSPNIYNKGETLGFRNTGGAIRFTKVDKLPFPQWVKEVHQNDLFKRMDSERDYKLYSIIEKDITRISKGDYKNWPFDDLYVV